jgi:hypothetical protein
VRFGSAAGVTDQISNGRIELSKGYAHAAAGVLEKQPAHHRQTGAPMPVLCRFGPTVVTH